MTKKEILKGNKLITDFMGYKLVKRRSPFLGTHWSNEDLNNSLYSLVQGNREADVYFHKSWDWLMPVVDKIQEIGANIQMLPYYCELTWNYSPKKSITFTEGNGTWKKTRKPFDSIGGKFYSRCVGVGETAEKFNVQTKIEAVYSNVVYFIDWYNKNVKK